MPAFAANLTMMFTEWPFLDRFDAAADAGFRAVEYLFPYEHPPEAIAERLARNEPDAGAVQRAAGRPGRPASAGSRPSPAASRNSTPAFPRALVYAEATRRRPGPCHGRHRRPRRCRGGRALSPCAPSCGRALRHEGLDLVIEPINARNMPGYFLNDVDCAAGAHRRTRPAQSSSCSSTSITCQIIHGDVTMRLRALLPITGHVQVASVPSRNEPDGEELNFPICSTSSTASAIGFVGCEYNPRGKTLDWLWAGSRHSGDTEPWRFFWLHRGRLHRRVRPRQHADAQRIAHGPDHRHPRSVAGAARCRCRRRVAEDPLRAGIRGRRGGAQGRGVAAGAALGHVLYKICSTFDPTDAGNIGPVTEALVAASGQRHRAGHAGLPGNRPHGLSRQSLRQRPAARREPAQGPSAEPDA